MSAQAPLRMIAILTLIFVVAISFLITKTGTIALMQTGMSRERAQFQARSAFSGAGFTTSEGMRKAINEILLSLPDKRLDTGVVDARDLTGHIGESVHFDTAAQNEIGRRFAEKWLALDQ